MLFFLPLEIGSWIMIPWKHNYLNVCFVQFYDFTGWITDCAWTWYMSVCWMAEVGAGRMRLLLPTGVYINGYWVLFILFPIKRLKYLTYNAARIISLKVEPPERKSLNRKITNTESWQHQIHKNPYCNEYFPKECFFVFSWGSARDCRSIFCLILFPPG